MDSVIAINSDIAVKDAGGGLHRKVLSHTHDMMVVEIFFEKGGVGAMHTHPHAQCSYIKSGVFEYTVEDKKVIVKEGDSITFAKNAPHGTVCIEEGVIVDVFTPEREDFL